MKKFQFPLARVRDWRATVARIEEAKLEQLYAELRVIESHEAALNNERLKSENWVARAESRTGFELAALDEFRRFAVAEHTRLEQRRADCARRILEQIQVVARKRRDVRLLENLEHKRRVNWRRELEREIESLAGESYLAKWERQ